MRPSSSPRHTLLRRAAGMAAAGLIVVAGSCRDAGITGARPAGAEKTIDISVASLQVTVLYGGVPANQVAPNGCFSVLLDDRNIGGVCGATTFATLVPGARTVTLRGYNEAGAEVTLAGPVTVPLVGGETAVLDLDVSGRLGVLTGLLHVNGAPVGETYDYVVCANAGCFTRFDAGSRFTLFAHPGGAAGRVVQPQTSTLLGTFDYTVAAGAATDLGTVAVYVSRLRVDLLYGGQPLAALAAGNGCLAAFLNGRGIGGVCGSWTFDGLVPGDHSVEVRARNDDTGAEVTVGGPAQASLPPAGDGSVAFELAERLGVVRGRLTVNGAAPEAGSYAVCANLGCITRFGPDGGFVMLAHPGTGTGRVVFTANGTPAATFAYAVAAGETADVGSMDAGTASLRVTLLYDGRIADQVARNSCAVAYLDDRPAGGVCGEYTFQGVTPGEHDLTLRVADTDAGADAVVGGPVRVALFAGQTTAATIDLTPRVGVISGRLTVNGSPAQPDGETFLCARYGCLRPAGTDGTFSFFAPPGGGTGRIIHGPTSTLLATFGYTAVAGQTTLVGTVEGGASGYTPAGVGVVVRPVDSTTGTAPVTLQFSAVSAGGSTRVTTGGHGPPPPNGTRPGRPTVFYAIETTAAFTGTVLVCINYDDARFGNESRLGLYHADASGAWTDVTTTRDAAANVVCGTVTSFSPFLVAEANAAPVVASVTILDPLVAVGAAVGVRAAFSDDNPADTHTASVAWDDGTTSAAAVAESGGAGTVTASHAYAAPGVYTLTVRVSDDPLAGTRSSAADVPAYAVVYDPGAGFVTGGGWVVSPAAACRLASCSAGAAGRATFGFVARYRPGASVPAGNAEFQFRAGGLHFGSTRFDWLVPAGARAQLKGRGQVNGAGDYGFLITAVDGAHLPGGGADRFRIKIWEAETGAVVYDNRMGEPEDGDAATELGGGSIVIHR